jgi:hypothetical protein
MTTAALLDSFMPTYDTGEYHETRVGSSPARAYDVMRTMNVAKSPIVLALVMIRGIPHFLTGKASPSRELTIDNLIDLGFVELAEESGVELVLGVVGRFWRLDSGLHPISAAEFVSFDEPGYAKAVLNFKVLDQPGSSVIISTETRIVATDDKARQKFSRYWRLIGPFSGFIRTRFLAAVKRDAETGQTD